ncbi:Leucyl aminopeptidase (aminopeptidase T) [Thermodesulfovibrio sp. N1]|uniref:aminopeptidase n=1 Tax=Thermodesulfovibrio sp. N1 TaxID=1871110 RepID=UPI00083B5D48|nr:aminopeptidase [Thermodesulfovibrio sp. N1]ODA44653.1 Leucyl aminopeptidase (aminopeptidase T) [Thermodesulfovibrio sp. N1]
MNIKPLEDIYKVNLNIQPHERLLLFTDTIRKEENLTEYDKIRRQSLKDVVLALKEIGSKICKKLIYFEYPSLGSHGLEPPQELWELAFGKRTFDDLKNRGFLEKLISKEITKKELLTVKKIIKTHKDDAVNAVIALSNFSTSHTNFRDLLTRVCGTRYASMPLFDISMLDGAMSADWMKIYKRGLKIKKILREVIKIHIETPNGTDITLFKNKRKIHIDSGILTKKGSFGNLPAGEVFLAPLEDLSEGRLVLEWAPTRKLNTPLILHIKEGRVVEIQGDEPYKMELERKLSERPENRNVAELGIGINDKASKPDNILESEKILGTIHIAIGDNSSFGGKIRTPFHQDFIFFAPNVYGIDTNGKEIIILKEGKILV